MIFSMIRQVQPLSERFLGLACCFVLLSCGADRPPASTAELLVVGQGSGQIIRYDPATEAVLGQVAVGFNPHEIELSQDGNTAYVTNFGIEDYDHTIGVPGVSISVIDVPSMTERTRFFTNRRADGSPDSTQTAGNRAPHGIKLRPPAEAELFVNTEVGDSMLVFDPESGAILRSFPVPSGTHNFLFSPQGDTLWLLAGQNGVYRFNPASGCRTGHFRTASPVRGLFYAAGRGELIASCENEIYCLSLDDLSVRKHLEDLGVRQIFYSSLAPDNRTLFAPCAYDSQVLVIDLETEAVVRRLTTDRAPIYAMLHPDGKEVYVSNALDTNLSVIDLQTYEVRPFGTVLRPNGLVFRH